ncbi:unnamed protein product [Blepharisma stoltei]|uniref:ATP synthase F0 subunit 8 n=1 Tax=Blepharisma stoltei TaxID=1481888 RepID=A0AAU9J015_9CILI|nr:unnamed protein product [Blepharisma stoltei]
MAILMLSNIIPWAESANFLLNPFFLLIFLNVFFEFIALPNQFFVKNQHKKEHDYSIFKEDSLFSIKK